MAGPLQKETKMEDVTESNYGRILEQYMSDIKTNEHMEKEIEKRDILEKTFRNSIFDYIFPWHMQLGRFEEQEYEEGLEDATETFAYTPFKTFNRRRNYLIWMHS